MREDYAGLLTGGIRGKYFAQMKGGVKAVVLDADVAEVFQDSKEVNEILRALIPAIKKQAA